MERRWPFLGRDEELAVITRVLVEDPEIGFVIAGPAGVGKTALAREVAASASAEGWTVRSVVCTHSGSGVPLGAFAEWAEGDGGSPVVLARQVVTAISGPDPHRTLLTIDDAHHLDELSAFVLHQFIVRKLGKVILTARTGHPLADAVTTPWKDGLLRWLALQPLSRAETMQLIGAVLDGAVEPGCADRFWTLTQGNVLLLRHLVNHELLAGRLVRGEAGWRWDAGPAVSPTLHQLVELQIGAIRTAVREVVDLVAVAEPIDRRCLARLADADAIEQAEHLGLITVTSDLVCVGHPLYAEVRLAQAGGLRLRRLRGSVAATLRDMGATATVDPLRLGMLLLDSDQPPDPDVLCRAAQAALARMDAPLGERLARVSVAAGGGAVARLQHAYALCQLSRADEAQAVLDEIDPTEVPGNEFVNDVVVRANTLMGPLRRPEEASRLIDEALATSKGGRRHQFATFKSVQLVLAGRPAEVLAVLDDVDFGHLDGFATIIALCSKTAALAELGRSGAADDTARQGYRVLRTLPAEVYHGTAIGEFHSLGLMLAGQISDAITVAREYLDYYQDMPGPPRAMAHAGVGMMQLAAGDLKAAIRKLDPAGLAFGPQDDISGLSLRFWIYYTEALARAGDVDGASAAMATTRTLRHPGWAYLEPALLLAEAWTAAAQQHHSAARDLARQAAQIARDRQQWAREVLCLQTCVQFGDIAVADRLDELARTVEGPRAPAAARYARALAGRDAHGLDRVSVDFEVMGDRLAAADAAGQAVVIHRDEGRRGSALTASSRATQLAQACGGASSPAIESAHIVVPITRREREVALLVARGLSNRQIADAMSLSVRTVEGYVQRAYAKTGVTTRSELGRLIASTAGSRRPDGTG